MLSIALMLISIVMATPFHPDLGLSIEIRDTAPSALIFDSNNLPEIVQNICWSQNCQGLGGMLAWDNPNDQTVRDRRRAAGCEPRPNRCANIQGQNCDEYPFARTYFVDPYTDRVNRCVPETQNNMQGGQFNGFLGNAMGCRDVNLPCMFSVGYTTPNTLSHCNPNFSCNDPNQVLGPGDASRPTAEESFQDTQMTGIRTFRTDTGMQFAVPADSDMRIGGIAYTVNSRNGTTLEDDMQVNTHHVIEEMS